jgi:dTDP-4-amino-4,6-dideoxygalactose transaminase
LSSINKISYGRQSISNNDIISVKKSLQNKTLTQGPLVAKLEKKLKKYLGSKYALVCSSGTAALHLSLLSIGLKKDDIIIMPSINFIAVYNLSISMGAKVILADVDPLTGQMMPEKVLDLINTKNKKKIKAIVTMNLGGYPENIKKFFDIKKKFNFYLIEDACHSLGSNFLYNNKLKKIGSCKYADISTFSLHPLKVITSGEGGIISTNNQFLAKKIESLRSHGLKKDKKYYWKYTHKDFGYNYRLSEINCSLAISQLSKIEMFIKKRKKIAQYYVKNLLSLKNFIILPSYSSFNLSSFHLFLIHINLKNLKGTKDDFFKFLNKKKIYPQFHYMPIYRIVKNINWNSNKFRNTEKYFKTAVSIPIYYNLTFKDQDHVIKSIKKYINIYKADYV